MKHESYKAPADEFDIDIQSCSAMDCTGLIPSLPQSDEEVENYNQLYHFLPDAPAGVFEDFQMSELRR